MQVNRQFAIRSSVKYKSVSTKTLEKALQLLGLKLVIVPKSTQASIVLSDSSGNLSATPG
ncbi:MAG: hypothetical protein LBH87_03635 [Coriobacteriales bacterium]|nr:hypothetical protein [Coriobacteriales bacterium]